MHVNVPLKSLLRNKHCSVEQFSIVLFFIFACITVLLITYIYISKTWNVLEYNSITILQALRHTRI